jgi:hypothetical protein
MPGGTTGYVNVLMDWDQNGMWGGGSTCPWGFAPEHVLRDFPVPNGFAGPLSILGPPPFLTGPNSGYVWTRFTITEFPVGPGWPGEGMFEDGESEDYLLHIISCPLIDSDGDGVLDCNDNCVAYPNGPLFGTCVKSVSGVMVNLGGFCNDISECYTGGICDKAQGDSYPPGGNGCGDACECYADIDNDGKVQLTDLVTMKSEFNKPCPPSPCTADLNGDGKVDLQDLVIMKIQFNWSGCPC